MFKHVKLTLTTAVVIAAAGAPSAASAAFIGGDPPGTSLQQAANTPAPVQKIQTVASAGFQWDDAGIGAAGALVLIGIGSGAAVARRRTTGPLAG